LNDLTQVKTFATTCHVLSLVENTSLADEQYVICFRTERNMRCPATRRYNGTPLIILTLVTFKDVEYTKLRG
jgi:hypothetical protein